ncbi:MAG: hypothetical protein MUC50_06280 [Myxococcota bacterium]|jgi:hypothetical protein|nr:hypothetical protein [Myxococcota bacterium]
MRLVLFGIIALFGVVALAPTAARATDARDILVIANRALKAEPISFEDVKSLFFKERTQLKNGTSVVVLNARPGSLLRKQFDSSVLNMTEAQEMTYWQNRKIKTGDTPPPEFGNGLKAVFKLKSAIGYIFRGEMRGDVADVIAVIPFVPLKAPTR